VDANWCDLWAREGDHPWTNLYTGRPFLLHGNNLGRCALPRHGAGNPSGAPRQVSAGQPLPGWVNLAFFDAHVELARLEKLWTFEWHRDWQAPAKRPDPQR